MHTPHALFARNYTIIQLSAGRLLNGPQLKRVSNCILIMLFIWLNFETPHRYFWEKFRDQRVHLTFERAKLSTDRHARVYLPLFRL